MAGIRCMRKEVISFNRPLHQITSKASYSTWQPSLLNSQPRAASPHHKHFSKTPKILIVPQNPALPPANINRQLHTSIKRARLPSTSKLLKAASFMSFFAALFGSSARAEGKMSYPDQRTDEEWKAILSPEQFRVIREKGTEPAYTGEYDKHYPSSGVYNCAACGTPLYKAETKFKSGCGWPAYFDAIPGAVTRHVDTTFGMERTEIVCSNCGGHLGHVFKGEGFPTPTDERHCVNSISLKFTEDKSAAADGKQEAAKA